MSFSRISVLAVFLMMVLSAFVTVPTYNVGADEGGCVDYDDENENGAYDEGEPCHDEDGPFLNAFPTGSGGDIEDYEMSLDENEGGASITVEATELLEDTDYIIHWEIRSYDPSTPEDTNVDSWGDKSFSSPPTSFDFIIGSDILNDADFDPGCYMFYGFLKEDLDDDDEMIIEEEDWPFTLDMPMSDCAVGEDYGFDIYRQEITVEMVSLSEWDLFVRAFAEANESDDFRNDIAGWCQSTGIVADVETEGITASCFDAFMENEFNEDDHHGGCPSDWTEDQCETIQDCEDNMSMACFEVFYDICIIGDGGEFCDGIFGDDGAIYYCSNDGEDYAESMGGILCPEGPDVVPMCPNDEPCVCIDIDGSCDDGDDDWGYYDDDDFMLDLIFEAIAYDRGDNSSSELIDFVSEMLDEMLGDAYEEPPHAAYYDVHEFNITEDEVANYTVEIDHTYNEDTDEWFEPSFVYLYEGLWEDDPMPSDAYWIDGSYRVCEYVDDNGYTKVDCNHILSSQLDVGSYSLFVTNSCHHIWEYNEDSDRHEFEGYDCQYGEYNLSITNDDDGSNDDVTGEITDEDSFFEYEDVHLSHRLASVEYAYFPYYEAKTYTLAEGSDVAYFHADKEDDYMQNVYVWLYEGSFNASDWSENLMYVSSGHENGDSDNMDSYFDMSNFEPGDYVFVTTGEHTYQNGSSYEAGIYDGEGSPLETWGGTLCGDDTEPCVDGNGDSDPDETDDRAYFTHENNHYFQNYSHDDDGGHDDDGDPWFEFFFSPLIENMTSYENEDITDIGFANNVVVLLHDMGEMGFFENDDDDVPTPEELIDFADANGDDQVSYQEFQDAWQQDDDEDLNWDDVEELFNDADTNDDDLLSHDELQHFIDGIVAMTSDDDDDDECPFTNQDFCRELEHMCNDEEDGGDHERCGRKVAHYCLENEDPGCTFVAEEVCASPVSAENVSICEAYNNFEHDDYHGNDGMPQLDGIPGAPHPHNWSEDIIPSDANILGMLGENQGKEVMFKAEFLLFFEDVNETLDYHAFSIPPDDGEVFNCRTEPGMEGEEMAIPFNKVNDGTEDCGDGADEPQYDEDEEEINWFDCSGDESVGHVEISMTKVNDGTEDCPYGDDELGTDSYTIYFRVLDTYKIDDVDCTSCQDVDYSDDDTFVSFDGEGPFTIYFSVASEEDDCPIENQTWCDDAEVVCDDEHADTNVTACAELVIDFCETEGNQEHDFCAEVDELCVTGAYPDGSEDVWGDWEDDFCEAYNGVDEPDTEPLLPLYGTKIYNVTHVNDQGSESLGMGVYTQNGFKIDDDNSFDAFVFSNNWWIVYFPTDLHDIDAGFVLVNDGPVFDAIAELRAQNANPSHPNFTVDGEMTFQIDIIDGYLITPQIQTIIMWASEPEPEPEPQPDCDHIIGLDNTGMAFNPIELEIKVGETVCWQWKDAEMEHNVLELEAEYDSSMNLADVNFGFSSGEPGTTVDFRHTFKEDNMTHYYVCEPHATTGMVGKIVVGTPEATAVDEAINEGLPSVSFIIGSLVLVGAAGLRRKVD